MSDDLETDMRTKRLTDVLSIRLAPEMRDELEVEAHYRLITVADLIRERLDIARSAQAAMNQIRDLLKWTVARVLGAPLGEKPVENLAALQIETLLLLRRLVGPRVLWEVGQDVSRLGFEPWTMKDEEAR